AARLLPAIAPGLAAASSVREDPGALAVRWVPDITAGAVDAAAAVLTREGSVGVIAADALAGAVSGALLAAGLAHHVLGRDEHTEYDRLVVVPATLAKGLEYDHVIVVEPAAIADAEPRGMRRLYVALTRAVSGLTVVHTRPLPAPLVDVPGDVPAAEPAIPR
ncbi:MAG: ATP-binding domain-containing protein, partial [Actinomycetota bacterium]|nr:ATP-binding domain-containing protein [Actinomycetota bacterium]